jgi:hypothetical protein
MTKPETLNTTRKASGIAMLTTTSQNIDFRFEEESTEERYDVHFQSGSGEVQA